MAGGKGRKVLRNGRSGEEQFLKQGYSFFRSDAFRSLSGQAVKVYFELRCRFNGVNNGVLTLSLDEAARLLHIGKTTAMRAFKELEDRGFIVLTKQGTWYGRQASEWRITDKPCQGHLATNDWKRWTPPKKNEVSVPRRDHWHC